MKQAYVFDIDGCLADCSHRLGHIRKAPKDWTRFFEETIHDLPIEPVCRLARSLDRAGETIVFASARPEFTLPATVWWLESWVGIDNPTLYLRHPGDRRDDDVVKVEMLREIQRSGFEVLCWIEDRACVVKALRAAGVRVLQPSEGNF